jgi:ubiquinone/menaquinone biosynthesis C-methylase UbiE
MSLGSMSYHNLSTAPAGNLKYTGGVATGYDAKREDSPKWQTEQRIIEQMLSDLPHGSWILDAPSGTGRFIEFCRDRGFIYRGLDISEDMIAQAAAKVGNQSPIARLTKSNGEIVEAPQLAIAQGNVLNSGVPDKSVDAVLNIRITRWLSPAECQQMFREMQRIARDRIILTARVTYPSHPELARPLQLFETAMGDDWALEKSEAGHEAAYRIFQFRCKKSPLLARGGNIIIDTVKNADDGAFTMKPYQAA